MSDNQVRISDNIHDLIGIGLEYLVNANGDVIAVFLDGNLEDSFGSQGNSEVTV
jgi:hypothetical protein